MLELLNTSNPAVALLYTAIAVGMILLAKKVEISTLPGGMIVASILLLLVHSTRLEGSNFINTTISQTYFCIAYDLMLLLLSFISYLWIDNIVAKKKKLKSYDDSLSWFWDKL